MDIGKVIGKGGFCEVRFANLKHFSPRGVQNFGQDASGAQKYAMKYLSPKKTTASRVFQRGIADLAMEACFLSYLRHENVIGLHYVSEGSLEENYNCAPVASRGGRDEVMLDAQGNLQLRPTQPPTNPHVFGYFLLLDPLHESLADRIEKTYVPQMADSVHSSGSGKLSPANKVWDRIRHKGGTGKGPDPNDPKFQLGQRLAIVSSIASALKYLHDDCRIIFRDIKPDNIGFYRRYRPECTCGYQQRGGPNEWCRCGLCGTIVAVQYNAMLIGCKVPTLVDCSVSTVHVRGLRV